MAPARVLAVVALALLATTCVHIVRADEVTDSAGAGRELLQGHGGTQGRAFDASGAQKHLTKRNVTNTGRLLLKHTDDITDAGAGRELLQGRGGPNTGNTGDSGRPGRAFDGVAAHKQPQKPTLTRKAFDRKMPTGRLLLEHTDDITDAGAGRELLQGRGGPNTGNTGDSGRPGRAFDGVAAHKQPQKPTLTRKAFDRKMPTGRLLLTDVAVQASAGRELLQGGGGPRPLDKVAAHKQPQRPVLTRKNFDRKMPTGRLLLEHTDDITDAGAGRELLQGRGGPNTGNTGDSGRPGRAFDGVAAHKQPQKPTLTRKAFDRKMPTGRLLLEHTDDITDAGAGRELLQGRGGPNTGNTGDSGRPGRAFDGVAAHKQPQKPTLTRKAFDRKMPTGRLLLTDVAVQASAGRELLQGGGGPRPLDKVAAHKQPQRPVLTRKNFDRKMPTGRLLLEHTDDITDAGAGRELLQGRGGPNTGNTGDSGRPGRAFDGVAAHKQPQKPTLTRKAFDRKMPTGRLLLEHTDDITDAGAGRELLQGRGGPNTGNTGDSGRPGRAFDGVAAHKQPQKPTLTRKAFDRKMPTGRLLLTDVAVQASAGRELLQGGGGPRPLDKVAAHKQPQKPTLTRKAFDRKMPTGL